MSDRQRGTRWYSASQADRIRKHVTFTLSDEAREVIETVALAHGWCRSRAVEYLILLASGRLPRRRK